MTKKISVYHGSVDEIQNIELTCGRSDVINAIDRYIELLQKGHATKNTKLALLDELKFAKPNDQICFKTAKSLEYLTYISSEVIND